MRCWWILAFASLSWGASFQTGVQVGQIEPKLNEVSGMAQSRTQAGVFWVHNDSGDGPKVYALDRSGKLLATYTLEGATARDWEDMAIGPAPGGGSYLYLADIGDNDARRESVQVYRVAEPKVTAGEHTLKGVTKFDFVYSDGHRDAESFMVDPLTGDFYVVSKREAQKNRLYKASTPQVDKRNTFEFQMELPFTGATGADISADGLQVLVRRYSVVNANTAGSYWRREGVGVGLVDLMKMPPETVALVPEIQGEAIAFAADGKGFYTTTERGPSAQGAPVTFYGPAK